MDFGSVKQIFIPVNGVSTEVIKVEDSNGNVLWQKSRLPSEYQEVEYIESNGGQHINTGVNVRDYDQNLYIELVAHIMSNTGCQGLSYRMAGGRFWFSLPEMDTSVVYLQCGAGNWATLPNRHSKETYKINSKTGECRVGANNVVINPTSFVADAGTLADRGTLYLFASHDWGYNDTANYMNERLYSLVIKNATTDALIRDFVPCYRKSDNEAGLYDLVTNTFYTNAGSGSFLVGGDV